MRVIGYTYEADHHCEGCTKLRHQAGGFACTPASPIDDVTKLDECGIPYCAKDREGNSIHPIFSTDEWTETYDMVCAECGGPIITVDPEQGDD